MRKFLRLLIGLIIFLGILTSLILATVSFQLLNPSFVTSSLRKPGVYTYIEKASKLAIKNYILGQIKSEGVDLDKMTTGERSAIEGQIDNLVQPINEENLSDFMETNTGNILGYVNGNTNKLILYLPISKWDIPQNFKDQIPELIKNDNIDVVQALSYSSNTNITRAQIENLYNFGGRVRNYFYISVGSILILLLLHYFLDKKPRNPEGTSSIVTVSGLFIIAIAWFLKVLEKTVSSGITIKTNPSDILIASVGAAMLNTIVITWFIAGLLLVVVSIFFAFYVANKNPLTKRLAEGKRTGK